MFGVPHDIWFWLLYLFSSSIFIFIFGLGQRFDNIAVRGLYLFFTIWLGFLFILLFVLFGYDIYRLFIYVEPYQAGLIIISLVGLATIIGTMNALFLRTREVTIHKKASKSSGKPISNTKIVQLSDLHLGPVHGQGYLDKIVEKTNSTKPDYVLITGDLADGPGNYLPDYFKPLDSINAPVFFTTGNHESYAGVERIIGLLGNTKVRVLKDEKIELSKGNLELIGISNRWNKRDVYDTVKNLHPNTNKFTILMNHQPVGFKEVSGLGVNLMLSGHTHGGQFFPFTFLARLAWRGRKGLKKINDSYMFVTNGTGTWGPPIRLGTSSEVVLIRLMDS
jgi:predicted MPP superfamily phosphohydrolase